MVSDPRSLTADDVLDLAVPDDAIGYEFVDGRPVPVMPASFTHGHLAAEIARRLGNHVIEHGMAGSVCNDCGFVLGLDRDPERMRCPEVACIWQEKIAAHPDPKRLLRCVPDLAIEIDLTSAKKPGGQQRIVDYLEAGVQLVWAIDPDSRSAVAYRSDGSARLLREHEVLDAEDVVPGFRLLLAELFGQAPPRRRADPVEGRARAPDQNDPARNR
jgi:Uma2 family endonuclease